LFVVDTGLAAVTCGAAYAVHGATETYRAVGLIFFEEAAGAGAQPVSAIVPATTFDHAGFVADEGGFAVAVSDTSDAGVTIEIVDDIAFLVVTTVGAFGVRDIAHFDAAQGV